MTNRFVIPLLCAASAVAFAKGTTTHKAPPLAASSAKKANAAITSNLTVNSHNGVEFTLDVRNNTSKMVELRFPTGKTHDFIVKDESGKEVWRWSKARMFTQGFQTKLVKSKDVATISDTWRAEGAHGKFTVTAVLPSDNHPIEESVEFELK